MYLNRRVFVMMSGVVVVQYLNLISEIRLIKGSSEKKHTYYDVKKQQQKKKKKKT